MPELIIMSATCTMSANHPRDNGPGVPVYPCGEPSIAVIGFVCLHEHVNRVSAYAGCSADVQQLTGVLCCPRCEDGPDGHECRLTYEIRWVSGEVTRG